MGTFRSSIEIGDPQGQYWETLEAVVDTGASYTWAPREVLARLGVRPQFRRETDVVEGLLDRRFECRAIMLAHGENSVTPGVKAGLNRLFRGRAEPMTGRRQGQSARTRWQGDVFRL